MQIKTFFIAALFAVSLTNAAQAQSTAYNFVSEYVRELGAIESIRAKAEKETTGLSTNDILIGCVRNSERFQLEITSHISMMQNLKLRAPFDKLVSNIVGFYDYKLKIFRELSGGCSTLLEGPKPGVDYGALTANVPKLNAQLEYIDKALFDATPMIFATLIDERPNAQNQMDRLAITKAERDKLVRSLDLSFGQKMKAADQNYTVSAASVLRHYLAEKGYKCSDAAC